MNILDLLRFAFESGVNHGQSFKGGTIDELFHSDEQTFEKWHEANQKDIDDTIRQIKDDHERQVNYDAYISNLLGRGED